MDEGAGTEGVTVVDIKFSQFFDRPGVLKKVKDGTKSVLARAGAFIRQRAKTSIRKRRKPALPGSPPSSHAGQLRSLIVFGYDESTNSVVIGPKLYSAKVNAGNVPHLLEFGGKGKTVTGAPALYRSHPYMKPALEAEQGNFPGLFSGAIKG